MLKICADFSRKNELLCYHQTMKKSVLVPLAISLLLFGCALNGTSVTLQRESKKEAQPTYTLDLTIPQVKGLADAATQTAINERLNAIVEKTKTAFLAEIKNAYTSADQDSKSGLSMTYEAKTLSQKTISLLLQASPYTAGAAHPNHVTIPFTYDVEAKKEVHFADLFNPKTEYLKRLSELTIAQLIAESKKKGTYYEAKEQTIRAGAAPKAENFAVFSIDAGNLVLTFDPYQVGPYAEGVQTVTIARADITDVLSNEGRKILSEVTAEKK